MISALSHFLYLPNRGILGALILGPECPRTDGDPDSSVGGGPAAGQKPRLAWRVCVKGWMKDPGSFLRKLHGVVGGGLRAQVETPEQAKAVWQASWHCGSLVEAGVSRKSPTMAAQGTQGSRRHSQRWRRGRLGEPPGGEPPGGEP